MSSKWTNPSNTAWQILKKYFPNNLTDHIKGMRCRKDSFGVVFDVNEDQADRIVEISEHLKETDSRTDFEATKCRELPDLIEENSEESKWRGGNDTGSNDGGFGGRF
jgi:hypothetical protein